jgi:hypothetical protein
MINGDQFTLLVHYEDAKISNTKSYFFMKEIN